MQSKKDTFHDYWFSLSGAQREALAERVGSSAKYLEKLAGGFQLPSLHMATRIVRAARGMSYEAIVRTYEAKRGAISTQAVSL